MSDLSVFDALTADKAIPSPLKDPLSRVHKGDDNKPVVFHLLPPNSAKAKERIDEIVERKRTVADLGELTREQKQAFDDAIMAAYVDGWSDNWTLDNEKLTYSEETAARVVGRVAPLKSMLVSWGTHQGNAWAALQDARSNGRVGEAG